MKPIDPTLLWSGFLVFLASPLIFLIRPVRKKPVLRNAALAIVLSLYLIAFVAVTGLVMALSGMRG
jgi:predicted PurR-regulated permease PerM